MKIKQYGPRMEELKREGKTYREILDVVLHVFASLLFAMKASLPIFSFLSSISVKKV